MIFLSEKFKKDRYDLTTQEELAEKTGVSVSIIKNMENGRKKVNIDDEGFLNMCEVLNLTPSDYFVRDTKCIAFFNNKGGVGKTSLVSSLASVLVAEFGKKILMIDTDAQANLTQHYGMELAKDSDTKNLYQAFTKQESIEHHIRNTGYEGLDILISHYDVGNIEPTLPTLTFRESRFKNIIRDIMEKGEYDYIFCDTSPNLSMFNNIIIRSCDGVIIPFNPEPFALGGIGNVIEYVEKIKEENKLSPDNHKVTIMGIIINKYDKRVNMSSAITEVVEKLYLKDKLLFNTKLPVDASVSKCQGEKAPLSLNYSKTKIHEALVELAQEVIDGAENI